MEDRTKRQSRKAQQGGWGWTKGRKLAALRACPVLPTLTCCLCEPSWPLSPSRYLIIILQVRGLWLREGRREQGRSFTLAIKERLHCVIKRLRG